MKQLLIYVPEDVHDAIQNVAIGEGISMSQFARDALIKAVNGKGGRPPAKHGLSLLLVVKQYSGGKPVVYRHTETLDGELNLKRQTEWVKTVTEKARLRVQAKILKGEAD